jgi:cytochrome c
MRIGPNLWGVVGRKAGTTQHFRYSPAMRQSGVTWTPDVLRVYIHEPQKTIPNIRMSFLGLKNMRDVEDVIAYLQTFR